MFGFSAFGGAAFGATGSSGSPPITEGWGPANREGYQWAYFLNEGWVELPSHETAHDASVVTDNTSVVTDTFISLTSSQLG